MEGSASEKFLRITIDSNFTFEKHMNELCKKGSLKLHALTRCAKFMSTEKRFKAFIISQFNYCPLVWMFHTKQLNNRINSLHEKALRVTYQKALIRRWIPNPGVPYSKPLGGSKVDSAFHPSEVDKMSTRNFWELSGKK